MRNFKISASQSVCLALAAIGITLAVFGDRTYMMILIPIGIGVYMPFYSLVNTGHFTYFPPINVLEVPAPKTIKLTSPTKDAPINLSCSRGKLQFSRHLQRHWTKSDRKIMYGELFRPVLRVKREPHPYP